MYFKFINHADTHIIHIYICISKFFNPLRVIRTLFIYVILLCLILAYKMYLVLENKEKPIMCFNLLLYLF